MTTLEEFKSIAISRCVIFIDLLLVTLLLSFKYFSKRSSNFKKVSASIALSISFNRMGHGLSAVLGPGDGIFIPSLWWHQVESFGKLNILVNYWWRDVPSFMGNPMDALMHSILSIRDLPEHQKENWANMFQHYVFNNLDENFNHIPDNLNGSHKKINDELAKNLRALLLKNLNR